MRPHRVKRQQNMATLKKRENGQGVFNGEQLGPNGLLKSQGEAGTCVLRR